VQQGAIMLPTMSAGLYHCRVSDETGRVLLARPIVIVQ
jgi:hypothetical protein